MNKQDFIKGQTCILKVDIHCEGCKDKVKKKLQKIDGVYAVKIEAEQGKVTVTGTIDPTTLIKKLLKAGKHAEVWGQQKGSTNNNQFKNMQHQMDGSQDSNNNKTQKGSNGNIGKQQNNGVFQQMQNSTKGSKDLKFPKDQKVVKFKKPDEEFDDDSDEFDDEFDDSFDDDDDDFDGHPLKPTKKTGGGGGGGNNGSKGDNGMMKGALGGGAGGGGNGKKSGGGTEKANEDKNVNIGKNGKGGGGGKQNQSGGQGGKNGGGLVGGEGKNGSANGKASGNGGKNGGGGGGGGKMNGEDQHMQMGGKNMPQMGLHSQMPQMGNYPRGGQMAMAPAAGQGLPPTMNPGLYQGMGQQGNPYMNQQQYMAQMMMMNQQQQAYGNGYQHPMMYARPMAAAMPPHPPSEDYGFMFSDENANSCSIM